MIGAQNARTLVKNQCRQNTTSSVFLVRIHVCRTIAPAMFEFLPVEGAFEAESTQEAPQGGICRGGVVLILLARRHVSQSFWRRKGIQRHAESKEEAKTRPEANSDIQRQHH